MAAAVVGRRRRRRVGATADVLPRLPPNGAAARTVGETAPRGQDALVRRWQAATRSEDHVEPIRRAGNGAPPPIGVSGAVRHGGRPASAGALNVNAYAPGAAWRSRPQPCAAGARGGRRRRRRRRRAGSARAVACRLRPDDWPRAAALVTSTARCCRLAASTSGPACRCARRRPRRRRTPDAAPPATDVRVAYAAGARRRVQRVGAEPTAGVRDVVHHAHAAVGAPGGLGRARGARRRRWSRCSPRRELARLYENAHLASSPTRRYVRILRGRMDEGVV